MKPEKYANAKKMRNNPTPPEALLWTRLRRRQTGFKWRRQAPCLGFILDFYCPKAMLCVEVDGPYHAQRRDIDALRDRILADHGITTLRVKNDDVMMGIDGTVSLITEMATLSVFERAYRRGRSPPFLLHHV